LLDENIKPLITKEMLPLINNDLALMSQLQISTQLMLEADRDMHQAVIAEKMALSASSAEEHAAITKVNEENVEQAEKRMAQAATLCDTEETRKVYEEFTKSFAAWKESTRKVFTLAENPEKLVFARKASNEGSAFKAFNAAREILDQLQTLQDKRIEDCLAKVEAQKKTIAQRQKMLDSDEAEVVATAGSAVQKAGYTTKLFTAIGVVMGTLVLVFGFGLIRAITVPI